MQDFTVTVEQKGKKFVYRVYLDGADTGQGMTSKVLYSFVRIQRWSPVGVEKLDIQPRGWFAEDGSRNAEYDQTLVVKANYGDADKFAARYSRTEAPIGSKSDYGYISQNVAIEVLS